MTLQSDELASRAPRHDAVPDERRGPDDTDATSIDALFRQARQRRRRRRLWVAGGVALTVLAAAIGVAASRGGTHRSPSGAARSGGEPGPASTGTRTKTTAIARNVPAPRYTPMTIGTAAPGVFWGVNGGGVYLTTDAGRTWRTITPPPVKLGDPVEDVPSVVGVGTRYLWIPVNDVFGIIPPQDPAASRRADGIEYSTDGGRTWTFDSLVPGCLQGCGPDALSFVDPSHGFATRESNDSGDGGTTTLFSTDDGGVTWQPIGPVPGGGAHHITFTNPDDGWSVTGATYGTFAQNQGHMTDPGGTIYRTTDSGVTWSAPPGLPETGRYELPTFLDDRQGVVLGERAGTRLPVVYVTDDGGATWTARRLPQTKAVAAFGITHPLLDGPFPFAAVSPSVWRLYVGPTLYTTTDAGRRWTSTVPTPRLAAGTVLHMAFSSPRNGLATALAPGCLSSTAGGRPDCYESLFGTTDGGRHWKPLKP